MNETWMKWGRGLGAGVLLVAGACGDDDAGTGFDSASATGGVSAGTTAAQTEGRDDSTSDAVSASADGTTGEPDDADATGSTGGLDDSTDDDGSTGDGSTGDDANDGNDTNDSNDDGSATTAGDNCEAPGDLQPCDGDSDDPFHAIGLNCPYDANQAIPIENESFTSDAANAWRVASQFGTYIDPNTNEPLWGPREGEKFLIISTGNIAAPNQNGVITMPNNSHEPGVNNANPDNQQLPPPMVASNGSNNGQGGTPFVNCDGVGDCSDSLQAQWSAGGSAANDLLWFQFEVDVPGDTHGFEFDFAYFSAEFPEYVNTTFNDIFVVWSNSETYTGNLCFVDDEPCTVTALWPVQYQGNHAALAGTGFSHCAFPFQGSCFFPGWTGGATGWYTAKASAAPYEKLQLTWAVFDMGDSEWDTAVIIDHWRWDCQGCVPSEINPCGVTPIPQ